MERDRSVLANNDVFFFLFLLLCHFVIYIGVYGYGPHVCDFITCLTAKENSSSKDGRST